MEKDRALNLLQNGLLPQVHGAYYEALKMAISDMRTITMLKNLTETHKQSGHAPTRTISMEDLRGLLNE